MADESMRPAATFLLLLNFCMYVVILGIGGWAMDKAIDHGFLIGKIFCHPSASVCRCDFLLMRMRARISASSTLSPIYFPIGNAATGFFVLFALIAGVVGAASCICGLNHIRSWNAQSMPAAATAATIAWALTVLAMGFACKEIELDFRNARLRTMEAFTIILSATQLLYLGAIHGSLAP
ncbi:hypothetical protein Ancab_005565 [Ancistrocladus abbreviatus]